MKTTFIKKIQKLGKFRKYTTKAFTNNGWGKLRKCIVGRVDNNEFPSAGCPVNDYFATPEVAKRLGTKMPEKLIEIAAEQLEELSTVLTKNGVEVSRPPKLEAAPKPTYEHNGWTSYTTWNACPRDLFLQLGNDFVVAPTPMRHRIHEWKLYADILEKAGANIVLPPLPKLGHDSFTHLKPPKKSYSPPSHYIINEKEICFEGADFIRSEDVVFCQLSNVTNQAAIDWFKKTYGHLYKFVQLATHDNIPIHLDATVACLGKREIIINQGALPFENIPKWVRDEWKIHVAPEAVAHNTREFRHLDLCSKWLCMNFISIDSKKLVMTDDQLPLADQLSKIGKDPILIELKDVNPFGGGVHCATLDILRD